MQVTLKESNKEEITYSKCTLIFFFIERQILVELQLCYEKKRINAF